MELTITSNGTRAAGTHAAGTRAAGTHAAAGPTQQPQLAPLPASGIGPLSRLAIELLHVPVSEAPQPSKVGAYAANLAREVENPLTDDDLQLALYLAYEQHYRSFAGIDPEWEWHPALIKFRRPLEEAFFAALTEAVGPNPEPLEPNGPPQPQASLDRPQAPLDPQEVGDRLFELEAADDGPSLSRFLERRADLAQFREFVAHRSLYQLKEADPHSWAIPRLTGAAKLALLEVQGDEYGGGNPERIHSVLFAKTMRALGMDDRENAYLDRVPGVTLATVNLMTAFGLHRRHRGMIVGHLAMFEMTSAQPNRRYGNALRRLGFDIEATDFYDEHVEADAVHENIAAYDLAGGLARQEPELAGDILFGARALLHLEGLFAGHLLESWERGDTSLLRAL